MTRDRWTLRALGDLPDLGIRCGDILIVAPGATCPVSLHRAVVPNFGRLLAELEAGVLRDIGDTRPPLKLLR